MLLPDTFPNLRPPGELPLLLHASLLNFLSFYNHVECICSGEKHAHIHVNYDCALVVTVCCAILGLGFGTHACMVWWLIGLCYGSAWNSSRFFSLLLLVLVGANVSLFLPSKLVRVHVSKCVVKAVDFRGWSRYWSVFVILARPRCPAKGHFPPCYALCSSWPAAIIH
jgi:hypothetical protein